MDITYTNNNIRLADFWNWLGGLRDTSPSRSRIDDLLVAYFSEPIQDALYISHFSDVLACLLAIRQGKVNPIGLRVKLKRRVYLVTPNGDLSLERPSKVNLQTISLDEMLARIGKR